MPKTALVYARASNDPTDQRISVDRQVKVCTRRAVELWPAAEVQVFRDDAITAFKPGVVRPGFEAFRTALRAARAGEVVGVVANEQSRLAMLALLNEGYFLAPRGMGCISTPMTEADIDGLVQAVERVISQPS